MAGIGPLEVITKLEWVQPADWEGEGGDRKAVTVKDGDSVG